MENIVIFKNDTLRLKYEYIFMKYYIDMPEEYVLFVKMVIVNFKRTSNNEDFLILILLYGLIFFKKIDIDNEHIWKQDRIRIQHLRDLYKYETNGDKVKFLEKMYETEEELFNLKMLIKYSVILFENKSNNIIISDRTNYYKSIWYILPYLTLKESKLLAFYQDAYFKQLYPEQFIRTKMIYLDKMKKSWTAWGYIISIVNNLTEALDEWNIMARIKMRKKSYFSIFNKIKRKQNADFLDSIWVRIIFKDLDELRKYEEIFEDKFVYSKKKDYIIKPKKNWYQSLHYSFMTPYANNEVYVELQLRTADMDKKNHDAKEISHYSYTIKKNKWDDLFTEVEYWYKHLVKYIEKQKK
jgi:hypothetical protein